jgi:Flp pilus assembly protein protease CpaA
MTLLSKNARAAGLLYILASAAGVVRLMYIPNRLFVSGNATATAANIAGHEPLFRWGMVSSLLAAALWLFVPLALYRLLKGVDQTLAALMVILGSLMQVPLFFVNVMTDAAALLFARGSGYLSVFAKPQRDAFARLFLDLHHQLDLANFIFAGLWLFPLGLLVYRSRFLPRFLGVWLILAGFAWLAFSVTGLLFPAYGEKAFSIAQPVVMGEVATMLWLVIMGAREKPAGARASAS